MMGPFENAADNAAEDARRLAVIRNLLDHFDWEYNDPRLALEAIDRISRGEDA
jgi:hypothetical protein